MGEHLDWKFTQVFGDKGTVEEVPDADVISACEFDETGEYLATGDRGGRIVVFEKSQERNSEKRGLSSRKATSKSGGLEYKFYTEFQSHEPEFDYLKSLEIEEKINQIRWCPRNNGALFLLSTNDKTVKLWKVFDKKIKQINSLNIDPKSAGRGRGAPVTYLRVPRVTPSDSSVITAVPRRIYANAHAYHVNSISLNSDGETFISADDLRVNLWHLGNNQESFNIVDMKPANMEELTEVITAAQLHPRHCNILMYSSSRGCIKLCDMRQRALCDNASKVFEEEEAGTKSFFSEIIASISDIKFSNDGRYILSRDYLTLKLWDMNMENRPLRTIQIHENLRSKLCDLYENDYIFDKFECCFSGCGNYLMTGSYFNNFHIYDRQGKTDTCIEATKKKKSALGGTKSKLLRNSKSTLRRLSGETEEFSKKVLHLAWHPQTNCAAIAASSNLFIYNA